MKASLRPQRHLPAALELLQLRLVQRPPAKELLVLLELESLLLGMGLGQQLSQQQGLQRCRRGFQRRPPRHCCQSLLIYTAAAWRLLQT